MVRLALNGLGRTGKLALRSLIDEGFPGEIVLLNDKAGDLDMHAMLLEFDTVHGRWPATIEVGEGGLTINGSKMAVTKA
ncbi:MAG: glyceraldehyde 3-phosphate dehydrogenase NAD-binding domain-containing protein, partial [Pseudomonadota bacterium]